MENEEKIIAIIITYNIGEKIEESYKSIIDQVDKIIFVDNGSNDITINTLKRITLKDEKVISIYNNENLGIAKALNIGVKKAFEYDIDFIMTLDHDSILECDMIEKMMETYKSLNHKSDIGIISPAIYDVNKKDYLIKKNNDNFEYIIEPIQSGSIIKKSLIKEIGLFNEDLIIYYVDTEFCYRAKEAGYRFLQCNNTKLYHEEGKKSIHKLLGKRVYYQNYSEFALYYRARNYIYMMKNYYSYFSSKDRILKDAIKIILFDKHRYKSIKSHLKGILDGVNNFILNKK